MASLMETIRTNPVFASKGVAMHSANAAVLGMTWGLGVGILLFATAPGTFPLGAYMVILSTFHFLEYFMTALFHPDTLSIDCRCCARARALDMVVPRLSRLYLAVRVCLFS